MSSAKQPLQATISSLTLRFGETDYPQLVRIDGYKGEPLFCHLKVVAGVLSILVDEHTEGDPDSAPADATRAEVVIKYKHQQVPTIAIAEITYTHDTPMRATVMLSSNLKNAQLGITDALPDNPQDQPKLEFVLIQDNSTEAAGAYRLQWILDPIFVADDLKRTDASVVLASHDPNSAMGPMGLAIP